MAILTPAMSASQFDSRIATPAVVAQRLGDLLQCFPSSAIGGVQWHTLIRKYQEKHGAHLDLEELGHTSALAGATALLWDVIRVVDRSDTDNPVVAIEDGIALTPSPGCLASWPSLYQALCEIVCKEGFLENQDGAGVRCHAILLSQVKPLLQRYWHSNFDELGMAYFTEEGSTIKLKKMKHLLQAVLRWRSLRAEWQASMGATSRSSSQGLARVSAVDAAVEMELLLVPSKKHNDLLLRCVCPEALAEPLTATVAIVVAPPPPVPATTPVSATKLELRLELPVREEMGQATSSDLRSPSCQSSSNRSCASVGSGCLEQELAFLRSENAKLRFENECLESRTNYNGTVPHSEIFQIPSKLQLPPPLTFDCDLDDPFEPPPQIRHWDVISPVCSTPGSFGSIASGTLTPFSESSLSCAASGHHTPVPHSGYHTPVPAPAGQPCGGVALLPVGMSVAMPGMPVWFQTIPTGVVQQARAMFEHHTVIPNWFVQPAQ